MHFLSSIIHNTVVFFDSLNTVSEFTERERAGAAVARYLGCPTLAALVDLPGLLWADYRRTVVEFKKMFFV